jgi:hypothetical protein
VGLNLVLSLLGEPNMKAKISTRVDAALLRELRALSRSTGVNLSTLVDEALSNLLAKRSKIGFVGHYRESLEKFGPLYEKLAE